MSRVSSGPLNSLNSMCGLWLWPLASACPFDSSQCPYSNMLLIITETLSKTKLFKRSNYAAGRRLQQRSRVMVR